VKPTAWLYLRVSSEGQVGRAFSTEGYSLEAQRADGHRKASQLEAEVTEEFIDPAETATKSQRPALERLLARLRSGDVPTYIIVHKVDRFARNRRDDANMLAEIMDSGAELVSATESIGSTPSGRLTHGILAAIAEYHSLNLAEEVKKGLYRKAELGGTPGYTKIGYLNTGEMVDGREVRTVDVDPERGPHVTWAFTAFKTGGYTLDSMFKALKERGLRTRPTRKHPAKPLSRTQIARMLRSRYYVGVVTYGGFEYEGQHESLTDEATFTQVQQILDAHSNAKERDRKHHHYLKGSLRCDLCDEGVTFVKARGKNGKLYDYFVCLGRLKGNGCKLPYLPADQVERQVAAEYARVKVRQLGEGTTEGDWRIHLEDAREAIAGGLSGMKKINQAEVQRFRDLIKTLNRKEDKYLELFYAEALPVDKLQREQQKLLSEQEAARRGLTNAEVDLKKLLDTSGRMLDAARDMARTYREAQSLQRRFLNQALFLCFRIRPNAEVEGKLREEVRLLTAAETPERLRAETQKANSFGRVSNKSLLAEREGFEPSRELAPPTRLAGECLQPLGHLSGGFDCRAMAGIG
jgi:site-specific DNA recombinase